MEKRPPCAGFGTVEYHVAGELWRLAKGRFPNRSTGRIEELWRSLERDGWWPEEPFRCVFLRRHGRVYLASLRDGSHRLAALRLHNATGFRVPCEVWWRST